LTKAGKFSQDRNIFFGGKDVEKSNNLEMLLKQLVVPLSSL